MPTSFTIRSSSLSSVTPFRGTGEEFFGREESDSQPALDHIETGGWAAGPADDVRFETGVAAGVQAKLRCHLAALMKNKVFILQL